MSSTRHPGAADRLVSLVVALRTCPDGMTAQEVAERVHGYPGQWDATAHRVLERDKVILREMGIPVRVIGTGREARYVLDEDDLAERVLPAGSLTADDLAVLTLAARAWRDGELAGLARATLSKLRALAPAGSEPSGSQQVEPGLSLRVPGRAVPQVLLDALATRTVVEIDYLSVSSGETSRRRVEPWSLQVRDGAWYLQGRDTERGQRRTFRLDRVRGRVRAVGPAGAFTVPASSHQPAGTRTAVIAARTGRAAALRARADDVVTGAGPDGRDLLHLRYEPWQEPALAGELAALGAAALVLGPDHLARSVRENLAAVAALAEATPSTRTAGDRPEPASRKEEPGGTTDRA